MVNIAINNDKTESGAVNENVVDSDTVDMVAVDKQEVEGDVV